MTLFRRKYRVETTRLAGWDYSSAGWYFVTICTERRVCTLGDVEDEVMRLSPQGEIVAEEWARTARIRPNVALDEWVIMPNHVHGIVVIGDDGKPKAVAAETGATRQPKPNSLSSIVGQFKAVCTRRIWASGCRDFAWQSRFYDHIIRDEQSLDKIRRYITENPVRWDADRGRVANLWM